MDRCIIGSKFTKLAFPLGVLAVLGMQKGERILNVVLGINIIAWGIAGFYSFYLSGQPSMVRLMITVLNIAIGMLIIFRKPISKAASLPSLLASLPSLLLGGVLFRFATPLHLWPVYTQVIFTAGTFFTLLSFMFLGKNFSVLPGLRSVVSGGTYSIIRHPGYFGELLMVLACVLSGITLTSLLLFVAFIVSLLFRINEEEKLLSQNPDYAAYRQQVKWKLLPYVW